MQNVFTFPGFRDNILIKFFALLVLEILNNNNFSYLIDFKYFQVIIFSKRTLKRTCLKGMSTLPIPQQNKVHTLKKL